MKINEYMSSQEAAEFLGISRPTLLLWEKKGKITTKRNPLNNYRLYCREDLQALLDTIASNNKKSCIDE